MEISMASFVPGASQQNFLRREYVEAQVLGCHGTFHLHSGDSKGDTALTLVFYLSSFIRISAYGHHCGPE